MTNQVDNNGLGTKQGSYDPSRLFEQAEKLAALSEKIAGPTSKDPQDSSNRGSAYTGRLNNLADRTRAAFAGIGKGQAAPAPAASPYMDPQMAQQMSAPARRSPVRQAPVRQAPARQLPQQNPGGLIITQPVPGNYTDAETGQPFVIGNNGRMYPRMSDAVDIPTHHSWMNSRYM